jgi:hypothetical protein
MPSAVGKVRQRVLRLVHLVEDGLHAVVHHFLDRVGFERAGRDDDEGKGVADQRDQRLVAQQTRELGEQRRRLGIGDMRFERHRAFGAQQLHQARDQHDRIDVVLLGVLGALEDLAERRAQALQLVHRVAGHDGADRGAADDQHLVRDGVHDGSQGTAGEGEAAEHHHQQDDDTDRSKHCRKTPEKYDCAACVSPAC